MLLQLTSQVPDQDLPLVTGEARSLRAELYIKEHGTQVRALTFEVNCGEDNIFAEIRLDMRFYQGLVNVYDWSGNHITLLVDHGNILAINNPYQIKVKP